MSIRRRKKRVVEEDEEVVVFDDHDARVNETKLQKARSPPRAKFAYRRSSIDYEGAGESQPVSANVDLFNSNSAVYGNGVSKRIRENSRSHSRGRSNGKATEDDEIEVNGGELVDTIDNRDERERSIQGNGKPRKVASGNGRKLRKGKGATMQSRTSISPLFRADEERERDKEAYDEIFNPPPSLMNNLSLMPTLDASGNVVMGGQGESEMPVNQQQQRQGQGIIPSLGPGQRQAQGTSSFSSVTFSLNRHIQEESSQPSQHLQPASQDGGEIGTGGADEAHEAEYEYDEQNEMPQEQELGLAPRAQQQQRPQSRSRSQTSTLGRSAPSSAAPSGAPIRGLLQDRPAHWGAALQVHKCLYFYISTSLVDGLVSRGPLQSLDLILSSMHILCAKSPTHYTD